MKNSPSTPTTPPSLMKAPPSPNSPPGPTGASRAGRALRNAAVKALRSIFERRLLAIAHAKDEELSFNTDDATIAHEGAAVAKLTAGSYWRKPRRPRPAQRCGEGPPIDLRAPPPRHSPREG